MGATLFDGAVIIVMGMFASASLPTDIMSRGAWRLLGAWLLVMVATPIVKWVGGDAWLRPIITVGVLLQASTVLAILYGAWGVRELVRVVAWVAVLTFAAEYVGSHTGFPFGQYTYTDVLQPQLGGVPLLIPFAWLMMLPCAWAVAQAHRPSRVTFALVSAAALTAWDLLLDPQMVGWGLWEWHDPHGYFGIPWSNYAGWLLTGFGVTLVVRPRPLPLTSLLIIYTITWFLESFGLGLFWGLPGPGIVGGVVMGAFVAWGYCAGRRDRSLP